MVLAVVLWAEHWGYSFYTCFTGWQSATWWLFMWLTNTFKLAKIRWIWIMARIRSLGVIIIYSHIDTFGFFLWKSLVWSCNASFRYSTHGQITNVSNISALISKWTHNLSDIFHRTANESNSKLLLLLYVSTNQQHLFCTNILLLFFQETWKVFVRIPIPECFVVMHGPSLYMVYTISISISAKTNKNSSRKSIRLALYQKIMLLTHYGS